MATDAKAAEGQSVTPSTDAASKNAETAKMRDSDIKWRERYKVTVQELEGFKAVAAQEKKTLTETIESHQHEKAAVESRLIEAELKAQALAEGITDLDLVKLIDKSGLKLENGAVVGSADAIKAFKAAKPNFFGAEKKVSSSTNAQLPQQGETKVVRAMDLPKEEWEAKRQAVLSGRKI